MTKSKHAVAYLRVSRDKQGIAGLGIEAQREAVTQWAQQRGRQIVAEFLEVESGRMTERPQLERARAAAKARRCTLVVAKLDRLSRDVDMIRAIVNGGEDAAFCDFPDIPEGPIGTFMLTMLAAVAEFEVGLIRSRTKAALAAAKVRLEAQGKRLGNPNGAAALQRFHKARRKRGDGHDNTAAVEAKRLRAADHAASVAGDVQELRAAGVTSLEGLAAALNGREVRSPRGGAWHATSVSRLLARIDASHG